MLRWFKQRRVRKRTAHNLYGSIVASARQPELFRHFGIPDTVEGRFETLTAHMFLFLERLRREGEGDTPLAQALVDAFFADMDTTMRELGVGDLAVPKKMRALASVFHERLNAYRKAMDTGGSDELIRLVGENLNLPDGDDSRAPALLAAYMRDCLAELGRQPIEQLHLPPGAGISEPAAARSGGPSL
jgi:cytochrome b pre-mRNA-processing protein 3